MAKPNDKIDEAVAAARETSVPLLIRRRCTPHQQAVWSAISFLLKTHPRADFGLREIAQEAGLSSIPRVSGWVNNLIALGLLDRDRLPEDSRPGSLDNFPKIRAKYAIPWKTILAESLDLAEDYVRHQVSGGNRLRTAIPSARAEQQSLFGAHVSEGSHEGVSEGSHEGVSEGSHEGVSEGIHERDRRDTVSCDPSDTPWMDGSDGSSWMDGSPVVPPKKRGPGRPPAIPPPPPADVYAAHPQWAIGGPLPAHPRALWANACPAPTAAHGDSLAALAAEHDASTGGHGWYWVGRAILAGTTAQAQLGHPNYIRNTLIRWRAEDSYGSDKARPAKERPDGDTRARAVGSRARRAAVPTAQPAPHLAAGSGADDLSDEELQRIEDEAGEQYRRYLAGLKP
jgi:hypothetical protein